MSIKKIEEEKIEGLEAKEITVKCGRTFNIGRYEFERIDLEQTFILPPNITDEEVDDLMDKTYEHLMNKIEHLFVN